MEAGAIPGGTRRNWTRCGAQVGTITDAQRHIFYDLQTSGGLLVAVAPKAASALESLLREAGLDRCAMPVGRLPPKDDGARVTLR